MVKPYSVVLLFLVSLSAQGLTVNIYEYVPAVCTYSTGELGASASGGVPPYTYAWNTGSTEMVLTGLTAGTYSVTVTDANLEQATEEYTLVESDLWSSGVFLPGCTDQEAMLGPAFRMFAHGNPIYVGTQPLNFESDWIGALMSGNETWEREMYLSPMSGNWPAAGSQFTISFTDAMGCPGTIDATMPVPEDWPSLQLMSVDGACSDGANGGMLMHVDQSANAWWYSLELEKDGFAYDWLTPYNNSSGNFGEYDQNVLRHDLPAGDYQVLTTMRWYDQYEWLYDLFYGGFEDSCKDTLWLTVPDLGYTCGTISGQVFMDDNQNCVRNGSEPKYPQMVMAIEPGNTYTMSDPWGNYFIQQPYGSYTIEQQSPLVAEHCVGGGPIPFELSVAEPFVTQHMADTALVERDVEVSISSGPARPGFQVNYAVRAHNLTPGNTGAITFTLTFDPTLEYVGASPNPTSVVGNTITWTTSQIGSFAQRTVDATFQVPASVNLIGTDLFSSATVSIVQNEPDLSNNATDHVITVTGSYDPNDKLVRTESNNDGIFLIDEDEWLDYTIRFQNTGTDTAFFVVVTDTLPDELDPATFVSGAASHPYWIGMSGPGILRFMFPDIMLPDSNVNELASHGFVTFRIKPRLPILPGTTITNVANIFFDYNPPIITPDATVVAETSTAVEEVESNDLRVFPNPASDLITMQWIGSGSMNGTWQVLSVDGRVVLQGRSEGACTTIAINGLAPGHYFLHARTSEGDLVRSFIKQDRP